MTATDAAELMKARARALTAMCHEIIGNYANATFRGLVHPPLDYDKAHRLADGYLTLSRAILSAPTEGEIADELSEEIGLAETVIARLGAEFPEFAVPHDRDKWQLATAVLTLLRYIKSRALTDRPDQSPQDTPPHPPGSDS